MWRATSVWTALPALLWNSALPEVSRSQSPAWKAVLLESIGRMGPELRAGDSARGRECPFFLCAQRNKTKFHSFSEAGAGCYLLNSDPFPHNSNGELCPQDGEPWRFRVRGQTAGGHRPHHRRLHQAEEGGGAELFGAVSVSRGEDGVVFGACHAPVLSLLRLRPFGGRVQLRAKNRKHYLPRGRADGGAEAGNSAAQGELFDSGRSQRSAAARAVARCA